MTQDILRSLRTVFFVSQGSFLTQIVATILKLLKHLPNVKIYTGFAKL